MLYIGTVFNFLYWYSVQYSGISVIAQYQGFCTGTVFWNIVLEHNLGCAISQCVDAKQFKSSNQAVTAMTNHN